MNKVEVTKIAPSGTFSGLGLKDLWRYRELLYFLTWRDVKIRYKQTAIGLTWTLLQPILTTVIFTILFSRFAQFGDSTIPYPLLALSGLTVWLFFQNAVTMASNSFVRNTNLVTKVYFPRLIQPIAASLAALLDFVISLVILAALVAYYQISPTWNLLMFPVFVMLTLILATAVGIFFAAVNVKFRDVKFALPFILQVWMIATPVFYPKSVVPEKWRLLFAVNPLAGFIDGIRTSIFGGEFDLPFIGVSCLSLLSIVVISLLVFKWMEDDFADLV